MTKIELAKDYQKRGWFKNMTAEAIENEILQLNQEIKRVDKRTYNGKNTQAFNTAKVTIAKLILDAYSEQNVVG